MDIAIGLARYYYILTHLLTLCLGWGALIYMCERMRSVGYFCNGESAGGDTATG